MGRIAVLRGERQLYGSGLRLVGLRSSATRFIAVVSDKDAESAEDLRIVGRAERISHLLFDVDEPTGGRVRSQNTVGAGRSDRTKHAAQASDRAPPVAARRVPPTISRSGVFPACGRRCSKRMAESTLAFMNNPDQLLAFPSHALRRDRDEYARQLQGAATIALRKAVIDETVAPAFRAPSDNHAADPSRRSRRCDRVSSTLRPWCAPRRAPASAATCLTPPPPPLGSPARAYHHPELKGEHRPGQRLRIPSARRSLVAP